MTHRLNPHAQALGRLGGLAKAASLSPAQRALIMAKVRAAKRLRQRVRKAL